MTQPLSRRSLLATACATFALPAAARAQQAEPQRLVAGTRILDVNGRPARVFGLTGPDGRPGIRLAANQRFHVTLENRTGARTLVHWHGQLPPWTQDGFPWPQTPAIAEGALQPYDYAPIPGTYWMHSHHALQEQRLATAPLIVQDEATQREDRQEVVLMLHDFTFRSPEEVLAGLTGTSQAAVEAMAQDTEMGPLPQRDVNTASSCQASATPAAMPGMQMSGTPMPGMPTSPPHAMHMDLNDVEYDAFLANDRTLADPEIVRVEPAGRVRLRIINGASSSQFWIDLGALTGRVVATDGHPVQPVAGHRFPLATAQRLDILVDLPGPGAFPVLAHLEGSGQRTGLILATANAPISLIAGSASPAPPVDNALERRLASLAPLVARPADRVHTVTLGGGMRPYAWSMNAACWPHIAPLMVRQGQRVEIELLNPTMMAHPIHLHGHAFQVIAIDGKPIRGAVRDTVLLTPMGRVRIAFDADNPGRWAFHCHNLYHMQTGMMTELRYEGIAA